MIGLSKRIKLTATKSANPPRRMSRSKTKRRSPKKAMIHARGVVKTTVESANLKATTLTSISEINLGRTATMGKLGQSTANSLAQHYRLNLLLMDGSGMRTKNAGKSNRRTQRSLTSPKERKKNVSKNNA